MKLQPISPSIYKRVKTHAAFGLTGLCVLIALTACSNRKPDAVVLSETAQLGELLFHDVSLSTSGAMSCATCHAASAGHAQPNALPAQFGGAMLNLQGTRTAPSIRYLNETPPFHFNAEGKATGGFFWDGRANTLAEQAAGPFFNAVEMALPNPAALADKLGKASYAARFQAAFGRDVFLEPDATLAAVTKALQAYQLEDPIFRPYNSQYDLFLQGKATLTDTQQRGLALFKDPEKGNCAACHPADVRENGKPPLFTDFTYDSLAVARNAELKGNANPLYFDLGLCARSTGDLVDRSELCGLFKVPSLRNVALRQAFFHNGQFKTLREAVAFYVQRDTYPEKFYARASNGKVNVYDDLPQRYKGNVNTEEVPYNNVRGGTPVLNDSEIDDVVAFLQTLNDGYSGAMKGR